MIYLFSGQPGHGKTTLALSRATKLKAEGRAVYVEGMRELDYARTGFLPLEDPKAWQDLPDGSVIVIDECYRHFPNRAAQSKVPDYIEALARHRHRGFDFIFIAQDPMRQVDPFIRGLVEHHTHVRRRFGTHTVALKTWDAFQADTNKRDARVQVWRLDKATFDLHNSATQHTVKRSIPWWVFAVIPLAAFVAFAGWYIASGRFLEAPAEAAHGSYAAAASAERSEAVAADADAPMSTDAYLEQFVPRVTGQPWTAPAFDQEAPIARPEIYCMSSAVKCTCITEQGTTYYLQEKICRTMARHGNYNPYRNPPREFGPGATPLPGEGELDADQVATVPGTSAEPYQVGDADQGNVWGDRPATISSDWH